MNYSFEFTTKKPSELLKNKNDLFEIIKAYDISYYAKETRYFNHYEQPVITNDGMLLSHLEDVKAAYENGDKPINVAIARSLNKHDYIRFFFKAIHFKRLPDDQRKILMRHLEDHLNSPEGKGWSKSLDELGYKDINKKCGAILNCSPQLAKIHREKAGQRTEEVDLEISTFQYSHKEGKSHLIFNDLTIDCQAANFRAKQKNNVITIQFKLPQLQG